MEDQNVQTLTLERGKTYTVEAFKTGDGGQQSGDALSNLQLFVEGDGATVEDNDVSDAASKLVIADGDDETTFRVRATAKFGEQDVEAVADITTTDDETEADDFMLVFTPVVEGGGAEGGAGEGG